jgi:hypothetical protein
VDLHTSIDLSGLADRDAAAAAGSTRNPTIKQTNLDVNTTLLIGMPTVLASIADPMTNRMLQIFVTVSTAS